MRAESVSADQPLEIACDESGSEGEKLIGGNTDVFTHAGVRLDIESAADCIQEIRNIAPSPALEYKANLLLREKNRPALVWLLGPSGPIRGNAHVHLTDKTFLVVGKLAGLLAEETAQAPDADRPRDPRTGALAVTLYREGRRTFGRERWEAFLESFNDLMRAGNGRGAGTSPDTFFGMVDVLRRAGAGSEAGEIMESLWRARPRVDSFLARLLDDPQVFPALDPLIPAIVRAVDHWGEGIRPVSIVHDRQTILTEERVARLREMFGEPRPGAPPCSPRGRLAGLRFVAARSDARVQVADLLAGTARKIASDELNGRGDAELTALLRPYVDPFSIWGDDRSRSLLEAGSGTRV
ncbi:MULTISPECIES: hypothetical protein [unclassified Streptosporangium]|uniref:hypothetical protein n=1 Tax=unclassified Streptosporangium TaxID=2632669 RepID=UPI002E2BE4CE|nr:MULTISPECIES: hypothetical protein [unclassified Streptosporangium]